jgi:hypothetical protein
MTSPNLGRLTTVQPRDVWVHEALNFTPWLLGNVDLLSDLLGMELEVQLYFGGTDPSINTARFEALHAKRELFEQALGEDAVWNGMEGRKAAESASLRRSTMSRTLINCPQ